MPSRRKPPVPGSCAGCVVSGGQRHCLVLRQLYGFDTADFSTFIGRAALDGAWQGFADSGTGVA